MKTTSLRSSCFFWRASTVTWKELHLCAKGGGGHCHCGLEPFSSGSAQRTTSGLPVRRGWWGGLSFYDQGLSTSVPLAWAGREAFQIHLPLYCFLGKHSVSCEEGETADDGQVLEGLEHVQVGPVHVHKAQHGCMIKTTTMESSVYSTFRYKGTEQCLLVKHESNLLGLIVGLCHMHNNNRWYSRPLFPKTGAQQRDEQIKKPSKLGNGYTLDSKTIWEWILCINIYWACSPLGHAFKSHLPN